MEESKKKHKLAVFIGRFQPFHNGHKAVIDRGLEIAERVLVLVGSANQQRSLRNPFTAEERIGVIRKTYGYEPQLWTFPLNDHLYNETAWISEIRDRVSKIATDDICLIGHAKDHTSYYLKLFPDWAFENVVSEPLSATDIREAYFRNGSVYDGAPPVPAATTSLLKYFLETPEFQDLCAEKKWIDGYKESWAQSPYPPTFMTVDNVVVCAGHVLLIQRGNFPGIGKWALPGGFLDVNETIHDGATRELFEETGIDFPYANGQMLFDDLHRDPRGRFLTYAVLRIMQTEGSYGGQVHYMPFLKASDDAIGAKWEPLNTLNPMDIWADHYHIIRKLTAGL